MDIKAGDVVCRKSYNRDLFFKVKKTKIEKGRKIAILKGMSVRLIADASIKDLEKKDPQEILIFRHKFISQYTNKMLEIRNNREKNKQYGDIIFKKPGEVLHIDSNEEYLEKSLSLYKKLRVPVKGALVEEHQQPREISKLLKKHSPDILVLTGHDALLKKENNFFDINSYKSSKYFREAVKIARQIEPSKNKLVIFAGASQSHYEALLDAGANFASSPQRTLLHLFDPVFIVEEVAYTPVGEMLDPKRIVKNIFAGLGGINGIETKGCYNSDISTKSFIDI